MKLYSTREFAEAAGVSVATVKYHVYKSKKLNPQTVAGQWVFTDDDLSAYLALRGELAAVSALSPAEKHARHREQQSEHMRKKRAQKRIH